VRRLLGGSAGQANELALASRADVAGRGLSPAIVARRLAALRSLTKLAWLLGMAPWTLEVESPRVEPLRDSRGPGLAGVKALLAELAKRPEGPARSRGTALIRVL
jgi:hypothetical protein